jgi:hypothetical protein
MTRFLLLAASAATIVSFAGLGPASAQEYAFCSSDGVGAGLSCTYETQQQCDAAVKGMGVYCYKNPRYTAPAVVAPQPAPAAPPKAQKGRATQSPGTKS